MQGNHVAQRRLTDEQRKLVMDNIGLVVLHLRRNVPNLARPRRDREWEDLFQEGCLGLIKSAVTYRPERGIPFVAYALPRIHGAVSRALQRKFSTVYVPANRGDRRSRAKRESPTDRGRRGDRESQSDRASHDPAGPGEVERKAGAKTYSLSDDLEACLADRRRHDPDGAGCETVGQRLRGKYERAVRAVSEALCARNSARGDRDRLVRILTEERFLVPYDEAKRPLRQIARETQSSYGRVAQCERQMGESVRATLEADPEFAELDRQRRLDPAGGEVPIDAEVERELKQASTERLVRRFFEGDVVERARILDAVLQVSQDGIRSVIRSRLDGLGPQERERLIHKLAPVAGGRRGRTSRASRV